MKKYGALTSCLFLALGLLTGCTANENSFVQKSFSTGENQVQAIQIDVQDRRIEVTASEKEEITLEYVESEKETYNISITPEHELQMTLQSQKGWTDYIGQKAPEGMRTIRVAVPRRLLASVVIKTTNGDVCLPALAVSENLSVEVNHGNITFEKLDVGSSIALKTKNGNIEGAIVGGYDDFTVSSEIKKGESNLPAQAGNGEKMLTVSVNNGNIAIQFEKERA